MAALTSKREVTVDRQEFFVHAEIFATFVTIQHIKITSAVKTISRMLLAPALRSAGVTMLGKTVELCHDELVKDTSPEAMSQLREALAQVHEHVFIYDRNYVADYLGWQDLLLDTSVLHEAASSEAAHPPEAAGGATETAPALASGGGVPDGSSSQQAQAHLSLVAKASLGGHDSPVLAVAWAPTVGQGISTDRDGTILSWNPGQVSEVNRDKSPTHMFTSVDIMHDSALVLLAGTAKKNDAQAPPPVIASYSLAGGAFTEAGRCPLAGPKLHALSCIPGTHKLVTAERVGKHNVCCTYDATRMMGTAAASALQTFHVDKASLSSICALDSQLFVCGAGDGAVQLWDMRQNGRQVQISRPSSQGAKGGISSMSVADTFAAAGSANGSVRVWDIRQPGSKHVQSLSPDSSAVQCLRLCQGTANAAVATLMGMYFLHDLTSSSSPAVRTVGDASLLSAKGFPGPSAYHDLAWVYPTNVLFAGGEDQRVDVYVLENPGAAA